MKYYLILLSTLLLVSCTGTKKIKPLVELTSKLKANSTQTVSIYENAKFSDFGNKLEFFTENDAAFDLQDLPKKLSFKKFKISSSKLATLPYVHIDRIYYLDQSGTVGAVDINDNSTLWKYDITPSSNSLSFATLSFRDYKLYITTNSSLHIIDAHTGKELVKKTLTDSVKTYPLVSDNMLFVQDVSNSLIAYDLDSLKPLWGYETWPEYLLSSADLVPVRYSDVIISSFTTGQLVALNEKDGTEIWQKNMAENIKDTLEFAPVTFSVMPILDNGSIYVPSTNNTLSKVDVKSSKIKWSVEIEDIISISKAGNALFVTNNARQLAAISKSDGSVIWASNLLAPNSKDGKIRPALFTNPIVIQNEVVVFSDKGECFRFNMNGGDLLHYHNNLPKNIKTIAITGDSLIIFDEKNYYKLR